MIIGKSIYSLIFLTVGLNNGTLKSQEIKVVNEESKVYDFINDVFEDSEKELFLVKYFLSDKGWFSVFSDESFFNDLYGNCLNLKDESSLKLKDILSKNDYDEVAYKLYTSSLHERINKRKLSGPLKTVNSRFRKDAIEITKPIFFSDKAIFYLVSNHEEKIMIFKLDDQANWVLFCDKYLYYSSKN
ncbi:MAG: hypothetical protein KTR22_14970 [Flavobacteriaceae bacterium]|nr:hypothetical protein [Flavobacteriaceae bacterium]